jgi:predicted CoA-binding protein
MESKKTVVLGASLKEHRASNQAVHKLKRNGFEAVPIGIRAGSIAGIDIIHGTPEVEDVHTLTLYLNPQRQEPFYDYILNDLKPKRIIFNPGSENFELMRLAKDKGIETEMACTLVMLSIGVY